MSQPAKKAAAKSVKSGTAAAKSSQGFTDDERAAMKERAKELKAEERANKSRAEGEKVALAAIAAMKEPDRALAKKVHAIVAASTLR